MWDVKHPTPTFEETSSMYVSKKIYLSAYKKNWWFNFKFAFEKVLASLWYSYWRPLNHDALFYAHHSNQGKIALRFFRDQFWDNTLQPSSCCLSVISNIQKLWMFWWAIENVYILWIICKFSFLGVITSIYILREKISQFSFIKLVIFKQNPQRAKKMSPNSLSSTYLSRLNHFCKKTSVVLSPYHKKKWQCLLVDMTYWV